MLDQPTAGGSRRDPTVGRTPAMVWSTAFVALGIVVSSAYGLLATHSYRGLPADTVLAARAQDVVSLAVAALMMVLIRPPRLGAAAHLTWLGMLAYVVYSYTIYLVGVPMNRVFLVYVVLTGLAGAAFLTGLLTVSRTAWRDTAARRLRRGTGWLLVAVAALFSLLWLSTLLPFALGGDTPTPEGVGGAPYPVFVLDLVVVLPCLAAVGVLLLRGHQHGAPLALVALVKIVTLFTALWAGVLATLLVDGTVDLHADAGPSLLLLAVSIWLAIRWARLARPTAPTPPTSSHQHTDQGAIR